MSPVRARLTTMIGAACFAPIGMLVALHPPIPLLLALACVVTFAHLTYQINLTAMTVDLFPSRYIASVAGWWAAAVHSAAWSRRRWWAIWWPTATSTAHSC